jgi:hypothetical protein
VEAGGPASNVLSERSLSLYARAGGSNSPNDARPEGAVSGQQRGPGGQNVIDDHRPRSGRSVDGKSDWCPAVPALAGAARLPDRRHQQPVDRKPGQLPNGNGQLEPRIDTEL